MILAGTFAVNVMTAAAQESAKTVADGYRLADQIHNSGQALVYCGMQEPAELYWEQLKGAGLTMAPLEQG